MPISIAGSGTITGISAGGLPDDCITTAEIAANAVTYAKIGTTEQGQLCKAWVNFNGTGTVAIRASYNVSSITDNGVGNYRINFTTAMPDANYAFQGACNALNSNNDGPIIMAKFGVAPTASALAIHVDERLVGEVDVSIVTVAIFR